MNILQKLSSTIRQAAKAMPPSSAGPHIRSITVSGELAARMEYEACQLGMIRRDDPEPKDAVRKLLDVPIVVDGEMIPADVVRRLEKLQETVIRARDLLANRITPATTTDERIPFALLEVALLEIDRIRRSGMAGYD